MLQRQLDPEGQELEEAVAQKTPLQQIAQLKHALFRSEVVTKLTCDMFESLKAKQQEQQQNWLWYRQCVLVRVPEHYDQ
jgi:hypothetical protein